MRLSKAIFVSLKSILWAVIKRRAICELFAILMPRIRERGEQAAVQFYLLQQTSVGVLLSYFSFILPLCKILIAPFHQLAVCYDQPTPPHTRGLANIYVHAKRKHPVKILILDRIHTTYLATRGENHLSPQVRRLRKKM